MDLTLNFVLDIPGKIKTPVRIPSTAIGLIPHLDDVVEDNQGRRHIVVGRIFRWEPAEAPSITLECVRRVAEADDPI
jgi:hypothetical protein